MTASAIRSATGCATPLTRLRRALPPVLLPILALGTFASIDALQTQMRLPEHALFMSTGDTVELTGVIRAPLPSAPPAWRLTISPDSVPVTLSGVTTSQRTLSDDTVWRAKLTLGEVPAHLAFKADISFPDLHHEASQSWQIEAWPDRTSMQEASPSLLVSKLGIDPLPAAFACLISALLLALLYPALYFKNTRPERLSSRFSRPHVRARHTPLLRSACKRCTRSRHCLPGAFRHRAAARHGGPS